MEVDEEGGWEEVIVPLREGEGVGGRGGEGEGRGGVHPLSVGQRSFNRVG